MRILMLMALVAISITACRGRQGDAGRSIVGPAGAQGPAGQDGLNGADGANGSDGINGQDGAAGAVGPKGADGTTITPIQFCPNVVSSYPSTFPEVGFLINGKIFAVYSANDGFLALMPPGTYNSNAVGSNCTFTINNDGTISN